MYAKKRACHTLNCRRNDCPISSTDLFICYSERQKVKMSFAEPFATLDKLIRLAKQGIEEYGYDEFAKTIENTKEECIYK